ncbi:MAG: AAC(3) family N-acetyltransferase [Clostridia bacterium]|nr:AAC(3) family N-acetyltransferase [Clostridia bacterium]
MYTKEQIKAQLCEMGIRNDDTVIIHTSFKAVGAVEGGPDGFIDAFCEYLSDGLFLVPTQTWANVNREHPIFDPKTTEPCIGLIPRTAYKREDGIRSLHPTHSMWAKGRGAENFIKGEDSAETPARVGGAWWKLGEMGAKILLIGVDHGRNTYIHAVDEIEELDDRLTDNTWNVTVRTYDGNEVTHPFRSHDASRTGSLNFNNFEKAFVYHGAQTDGRIGDAYTRVVDAAKCKEVLLRIYSRTTENLCLTAGEIPEEYWK